MRQASPRIRTYSELIREFEQLYKKSLTSGHKLRAARYLRAAEFYMASNYPKRNEYRKQFVTLMREHFAIGDKLHHLVPYENGFTSGYRLTPANP